MSRPIRPPRRSNLIPQLEWILPAQIPAFEAAGTNAHRLASSSRTWIERLGEDAIISFQYPEDAEPTLNELKEWCATHKFPLRRIFGRFVPRQNVERSTPRLMEGPADLSLEISVQEANLNYCIDFSAGYSAGLFLDQRANRAWVRGQPVKRMLNTFAYTCSFSVVAASIGAESVSVDLSKKSLDRGQRNFALNGLPQDGHRFIADDVMDVLPRLARRGEKFDTIILDPPTFSRGNEGRRWQVEKDFPDLLSAALEVAADSARILLSTNCTKLSSRDLELFGRHALKLARRAGDFSREPELPDIPAELAARTVWMRVR